MTPHSFFRPLAAVSARLGWTVGALLPMALAAQVKPAPAAAVADEAITLSAFTVVTD